MKKFLSTQSRNKDIILKKHTLKRDYKKLKDVYAYTADYFVKSAFKYSSPLSFFFVIDKV